MHDMLSIGHIRLLYSREPIIACLSTSCAAHASHTALLSSLCCSRLEQPYKEPVPCETLSLCMSSCVRLPGGLDHMAV
jgi:hypothetical protein